MIKNKKHQAMVIPRFGYGLLTLRFFMSDPNTAMRENSSGTQPRVFLAEKVFVLREEFDYSILLGFWLSMIEIVA